MNAIRPPKDEATDLMNMLVPFAERMLREHGESFPYGAVMMPDGSMKHFAASDGTEHPSSKDLIDLLVATFREDGRQGKYKATGIVYDVMTLPPGAERSEPRVSGRGCGSTLLPARIQESRGPTPATATRTSTS